jgi:hypothetical protein
LPVTTGSHRISDCSLAEFNDERTTDPKPAEHCRQQAYDGVSVARETIHSALGVSLDLSSLTLAHSFSMLLLAIILPRLRAGEVSDLRTINDKEFINNKTKSL